jgi:NADPH:quinone reductase-like Zn-dependent oxidoreductase
VLLNPGVSCRQCPQCAAGDDNLCRTYHVFGSAQNGGYAELVKTSAFNIIPIPGDLSFEEAAAVPLVFVTAWHMLVGRARMKTGETVLVLGAGSGVGSAAIQVAKLFRGRVIATAGSEAKLAKARELGADEVINHSTQDIAAEVRRLTAKRGVDIVVEHVGTATWKASFMSLAVNGRVVTCGNTTGWDAAIDLRYLFNRHLSVLGSFMGRTDELLTALEFIGKRLMKAVIDRSFPLSQARQAQEYLEGRQQFGKVLLIPD